MPGGWSGISFVLGIYLVIESIHYLKFLVQWYKSSLANVVQKKRKKQKKKQKKKNQRSRPIKAKKGSFIYISLVTWLVFNIPVFNIPPGGETDGETERRRDGETEREREETSRELY